MESRNRETVGVKMQRRAPRQRLFRAEINRQVPETDQAEYNRDDVQRIIALDESRERI